MILLCMYNAYVLYNIQRHVGYGWRREAAGIYGVRVQQRGRARCVVNYENSAGVLHSNILLHGTRIAVAASDRELNG